MRLMIFRSIDDRCDAMSDLKLFMGDDVIVTPLGQRALQFETTNIPYASLYKQEKIERAVYHFFGTYPPYGPQGYRP